MAGPVVPLFGVVVAALFFLPLLFFLPCAALPPVAPDGPGWLARRCFRDSFEPRRPGAAVAPVAPDAPPLDGPVVFDVAPVAPEEPATRFDVLLPLLPPHEASSPTSTNGARVSPIIGLGRINLTFRRVRAFRLYCAGPPSNNDERRL